MSAMQDYRVLSCAIQVMIIIREPKATHSYCRETANCRILSSVGCCCCYHCAYCVLTESWCLEIVEDGRYDVELEHGQLAV